MHPPHMLTSNCSAAIRTGGCFCVCERGAKYLDKPESATRSARLLACALAAGFTVVVVAVVTLALALRRYGDSDGAGSPPTYPPPPPVPGYAPCDAFGAFGCGTGSYGYYGDERPLGSYGLR